MTKEIIKSFRHDLLSLNEDWEKIFKEGGAVNNQVLLEKIAADIQKLDRDATLAATTSQLKEQAEIVLFALTTPWGAPFIGETTLLDAARNFKKENLDSSLKHLLIDFARYGHQKEVPLFSVLKEITKQL